MSPIERTPSHASRIPRPSPRPVRRTVSIIAGRITWTRVPPRAERMAISRPRCTPRASRRLATLTAAISSTIAAAAKMRSSGARTVRVPSAWSGSTRRLSPRRSGCSATMPSKSRTSSACAAAGVAPSRRRPITSRKLLFRIARSSWVNRIGTHTWARATWAPWGTPKRRGTMPTTVVAIPSSRMLRPTTAGSPPNRSRQSSSLSTATGSRSSPSSSGRISRPRSASTPSIGKRFPLARLRSTWIAWLGRARSPVPKPIAASSGTLVASRARSR